MKHRPVLALALAATACAALAASAAAGRGHHARPAHPAHPAHPARRAALESYTFRGQLLATAAASVQVQVDGGSHDALRALLGQDATQTFAVASSTRVVVRSGRGWRRATLAALHDGDPVLLTVRALRGSSLASIVAAGAAQVADDAPAAPHATGPLYLYVGTVSGPQPATSVALHVTSGNWRALQSLLGAPVDQTFTTGAGTIYLLWHGSKATVVSPAQLQAGDRVTVRVHAAAGATLAQIEATPAAHVGDHEPGNPATEN